MIIAIQGVSKRFGVVTAVDRVDLTVADGELFTLLGPSGCGKTTLLRLLAGFYQPDGGTIRFGDRVVNGLPPYERRIGMVFQNYALWPHMTVADNICYGLRLRKLPAAEVQARLQEGLRITTIYVTHDQEEALSLSDRVAVMRDGHVLQVGPPKELYERPRTRFVADFVGTNNLVPGEVQGDGGRGGDLVVSTALGPLRAVANGPVSGRCVLAVRPENVTLGAASTGEGNHVAGRVSLVSYLGNTLRYDVQTEPGLVLKADIRDPWHHDPLPVGRPVTLSFLPSVT